MTAVVNVSARVLDGWLSFAGALADGAHAMLAGASRARPDAVVKPDRGFVTALDSAIEHRLREMIVAQFPTHGILGEEGDAVNLDAELVWVLDPIDGTAPFIAGVPVYGTLICPMLGGYPILGIIDMAATADCWIGAQGRPTVHVTAQGALPTRTRHCASLQQAILTSSNPDFFCRSGAASACFVAAGDGVAHLWLVLHELWPARVRPHRYRL